MEAQADTLAAHMLAMVVVMAALVKALEHIMNVVAAARPDTLVTVEMVNLARPDKLVVVRAVEPVVRWQTLVDTLSAAAVLVFMVKVQTVLADMREYFQVNTHPQPPLAVVVLAEKPLTVLMVIQTLAISVAVVAEADLVLVGVTPVAALSELYGAAGPAFEHSPQQIQIKYTQILVLMNSINSPKRLVL